MLYTAKFIRTDAILRFWIVFVIVRFQDHQVYLLNSAFFLHHRIWLSAYSPEFFF